MHSKQERRKVMYYSSNIKTLLSVSNTEDKKHVVACVNTFKEYVNVVVDYQMIVNTAYELNDMSEGQRLIKNIDLARHNAHEEAIAAMRLLKLIAADIGMSSLIPLDLDKANRYQIADLVGDIILDIYKDAIGVRKEDKELSGMEAAAKLAEDRHLPDYERIQGDKK